MTPNPAETAPAGTCRIWNDYAEARKKGKESLLLDFSFAGYRHGEEGVPEAEGKIFNVCDYGAVPNDGKSDREAFEKAIAAAEANGSGIIFFPRGQFHLRPEGADNVPIAIKGNNIILKGSGCGPKGTELFMEYPNPAADPEKLYSSPCLIVLGEKGHDKKITEITGDSRKGTFEITVRDASSIRPGDWICLYLKNNDPELIAEELAPYTVKPSWKQILNEGVMVNDYHQVVSVKKNKVILKEPVMHDIDRKWGWTVRTFPHSEGIGVEDIAFRGNFHEKFVHHKNWFHDGGFKPLYIRNAVNSWVRRCRFTDVSEALTVASCANMSVTECKITGNGGHSAIRAQGSSRIFLGMIDDQPAQWHSVGFSKPSMGTVLWRITTAPNSCFESHATQPRASLIDCCRGGFARKHAGGAASSNPNHLADLVIWNYKETDEPSENFDFWADDSEYWKFLPPIIVGFHGKGTTFLQSQIRYEESNGTPVEPESLYEAQLEFRLGYLPQWIIDLKERH